MKNKLSFLKNQTGISMLEVTVAMGLVGLLSVGTMRMLDTAQKQTRRNEMRTVAGQVTLNVKDYLNSKEICKEAIYPALAEPEEKSEEAMMGRLDGIFRKVKNSEGEVVSLFPIISKMENRPDGLRVDDIEVFYEGISDIDMETYNDDSYNKQGSGRVRLLMSYCPNGGSNCKEEDRKPIHKAIPLKEIYTEVDDDGKVLRAVCSSSQDGILDEAERMVDVVQRQVCQLAFANAAMSGDMKNDPECGKITEIKEVEGPEITSSGPGQFPVPMPMNLKACRFTGVVPGTLQIALSGGGGGGHGASRPNSGDGGSAGEFVLKKINPPAGEVCSFYVGKGGRAGGSHNDGSGGGDPGEDGEESTFSCRGEVLAIAKGGPKGRGEGGDGDGRRGENSNFFEYLKGFSGGGGAGAKKGGDNAKKGEYGGGGGGGAKKTFMKGVRQPAAGGDGGVKFMWKEYTVEPLYNIHDCEVCEAGEVRNHETGACEEMCSGYNQIYNEESDSCLCGEGTIKRDGQCVSCQQELPGSVKIGSMCSCPAGTTIRFCGGREMCVDPGQEYLECHNPHGQEEIEPGL